MVLTACLFPLGLFVSYGFEAQGIGWFLWILALLTWLFWPAMMIHEGGHAVAANLVGCHPYRVILGQGRLLKKQNLAGIIIELRSIPIFGFTFVGFPSVRWLRVRRFLTVLGGPAANFAACGFFLFLTGSTDELAGTFTPFGIFALVNLLMAVTNLFPKRYSIGLQQVYSDGLGLYKAVFPKASDLTEWKVSDTLLRWHHFREEKKYMLAEEVAREGAQLFPTNLHARLCLGLALLDLHRTVEARQEFIACLSLASEHPPSLAIVKNNIAFTDALISDAFSLIEADRYSKEAVETLGWHPSLSGTRALVLIQTGHPKEGLELLARAEVPESRDEDKALHLCTQALGLLATGETKAATESLSKARQLDPSCPLNNQLESAMASPYLKVA
jgi:Flp pilus assembly protein TadD